MVELIKNLLGTVFITLSAVYIVAFLTNKKINIFKVRNLFYFSLAISINWVNLLYVPANLRLFVTTIVLVFIFKIMFEQRLTSIACAVVVEQLIFVLSEIIYMVLAAVITGMNAESLVNTTIGALLSNLIISLMALFIAKTSLPKRVYLSMLNALNNFSNKKLIIMIGSSILIINFLLGISYFKANIGVLLVVNGFFIAFIIYIMYTILEEKNLNLQYRAENDTLHDSLNTYENLVDQHRVINHENRNQLGSIREMIESGDTTVISYIDRLVKRTYEKDETLLDKTKRIPSGGLQGIIYQKLLIMKEKGIPNGLNISRDIKESDFKKLDMDTNIDLCKIVGVFLDNAIEEVERVKKKKIIIDVYMEENNFCVRVTNNYGSGIDFSRIDEKGYTTKEEGHGYGLALVKEIIGHNSRFRNLRAITGQSFSQIIMVSDMSIDE